MNGKVDNICLSRMNPAAAMSLMMIALLVSGGLLGCGQDKNRPAASQQSTDDALTVKTERGPLTAVVAINPKEPRVSDLLTVTLTVTAPNDIDIKLPEFRSAFDELVVRDFQDPLPQTEANQVTVQHIYQLEPQVAGPLVIPPFTITYQKTESTDAASNTEMGELITDELKFTVATMVDPDSLSLDALKPAAAPIALSAPAKPFPWLQWLVGVISVFVAGAVWWIRSKRVRPENRATANEVATLELNQLVADQSARNDLRSFYVQLTGIVRRYIEAVTGVNAAEQTTEEFLTEMQDKQLFSSSSNLRLQEFLEASDLIKFAGQTPSAEAVEDSIYAARQFIQLPPMDDESMGEPDVPSRNL